MGVGPGALSDNATIAANDLYEKRGVITVASLRTFYGAVVPKPTVQTMSVPLLSSTIASVTITA